MVFLPRSAIAAVLAILLSGCDQPGHVAPDMSVPDLSFVFPDLSDPAGPMEIEPVENLANVIEPPDGSGEWNDADFAAVLRARIYEKDSFALLSPVSASANGWQKYSGTTGRVETEMDLYWGGQLRASKDAEANKGFSVVDWLSSSLGYCSTYVQIQNGIIISCPHELQASVNPVDLQPDCGWNVRVASDHYAGMTVKGLLWSQDPETSDDEKTGFPCSDNTDDDDTPDSGSSGGSAGPMPGTSCRVYTCTTYYWEYQNGSREVISTSCYCSGY